MEDIFRTLQERGDCNRFLRLINETDMDNIISGVGPYTVFAPTDSAFDNLHPSFHQMEPDFKQSKIIVSNHIITWIYRSRDLRRVDEVTTMSNNNLAIERHNEGLIVGSAKIIETDIECTNGILHIIDLVLI